MCTCEHVCWGIGAISAPEGAIGGRVADTPKGCVPLIIQLTVLRADGTQVRPHIFVGPIEERIDAHEWRPAVARRAEEVLQTGSCVRTAHDSSTVWTGSRWTRACVKAYAVGQSIARGSQLHGETALTCRQSQ
jgi:hypothetical protein